MAMAPGWRFRHGAVVTFGTRVLGVAAVAAASILAARGLGPGGKGALAVVGLVSSLAMQFGNLGLHAAAIHFTARSPHAVMRVAAFSLTVAVFLGGVLALLTLGVWALFPKSLNEIPIRFLFIAVMVIPFGLALQFFQGILLGQHRLVAFNLLDLSGKIAGLAATAVLISLLEYGVWELLVASLLLSVGSSVGTVWLAVHPRVPSLRVDWGLAREMMGYGAKSYVACLLAFLLIRADLLMVNYYLGAREAGWYSVAVSFTDLLYIFPSALATVLFPRVSAGDDTNGTLTAQVSRVTFFLFGGMCLLAWLLADLLVRLCYGIAFLPSVRPLVWLLPGVFLMGMLNVYAQHFAGTGYPLATVVVWIPGLVLNVVLNLFWIPAFGLVGAAWSSSLCYGGLAVFHLWYFLRRTGRRPAEVFILRRDEIRDLLNVAGVPGR